MKLCGLTVLLASFSLCAAFTHPGLLHTAADFERIKSAVNAGKEPWLAGWHKLTNSSYASASYVPHAQKTIYRGSDGIHAQNYPDLYRDIAAAYALAIRWKVSGNTTYADAAIAILNAWSATLTAIGGDSDQYLAAGIYGYEFANAGEIMRAYSGWPEPRFQEFQDMMVKVFYPMNDAFLTRHNGAKIDHYWANWDLCNVASVISIGILSDNQTMYEEGINYFKSGGGNGQIEKAIWKLYTVDRDVLGQGQEAGRDQGHSMLDFAIMGPLALSAYNQGDDLFEYLENRILAG